MNKNKHLTQSERVSIELHLNNHLSFKAIGRELTKDPTTIAKEVKTISSTRVLALMGDLLMTAYCVIHVS